MTFTVACAVGDWNGSACKDPVSATVTLSSGKIALDGKTADGTATCTEKGSQGGPVSYKLDGKSLSTCTETGTAVALTFGQNTLTAYDAAGKQLGEAIVDVTCADGTWNGTACKTAPLVYHYNRLNLVIMADLAAYVGVLDDTTKKVVPLLNKTGYDHDAAYPVAFCGIWDKLLPDGRPLASCQTIAAGNLRRNFPISPLTRELMEEYTGAVPVGSMMREGGYGTFGDTPYAAFDVGMKGMYIDVPSVGTYYVTNVDRVHLRLTTDGFKTSKIIAQCGEGDCYHYLTTFSNP